MWKRLENDPIHCYEAPQGCPMQSMPIKHGMRRCNLKKYAKRVLFKADFAVFSAQKELVEAPNRAQNTLNHDEKCLFII